MSGRPIGSSSSASFLNGERPAWMEQAACKGVDQALFFPGSNDSHDPALAYCAICPVLDECGEMGLTERYGIWGGMSERTRRRIASHRRRQKLGIEDKWSRLRAER